MHWDLSIMRGSDANASDDDRGERGDVDGGCVVDGQLLQRHAQQQRRREEDEVARAWDARGRCEFMQENACGAGKKTKERVFG